MTVSVIVLILVVLACIIWVESSNKPSHWPLVFILVYLTANYWTKWVTFPLLTIEQILMAVGTYFAIGVSWSLLKWYRFCQRAYREEQLKPSRVFLRPKPSNSQLEISVWITWWPFSLANSIASGLFIDS
jgi:hypothetical protein